MSKIEPTTEHLVDLGFLGHDTREGASINPGDTNKKSGLELTIPELKDYLGKRSDLLNIEGVEMTPGLHGSFLLLTHDGIRIVGPAEKWRRQHIFNDENEVIAVTPGNNERIMLSEIAVIAIRKFDKEEVEYSATKYIHDYLVSGGIGLGPEIETSLDVKEETDCYPFIKAMQELSLYQREFQQDNPFIEGDFLQNIKSLLRKNLFFDPSFNSVLINMAGTHPAEIDINKWRSLTAEDGPIGPYVGAIVHTLQSEYIQPEISSLEKTGESNIEPNALKAWHQAAEALGYKDVFELVKAYSDMRFWVVNALHVSAKAVTSEKDGFMCEQSAKSVTNLYTAYSHVLDGLCFSGGYAFGKPIKLEGKIISDARSLLKRIMPTSASTDELLTPSTDLGEIQTSHILAGRTNTPDRASLTVRHNGILMTAQHGDARVRGSMRLDHFIKAKENNDAKNISLYRRIEYTGRSATPDLEKYSQSVALQEVLTIAGVMATSEGSSDVFQWLADHKVYTEGYFIKTGRTKLGKEKLEKALRGDFSPNTMTLDGEEVSFNPITELVQILTLVSAKLEDRNGGKLPDNVAKTFNRALSGLESLLVNRDEYLKLPATERFNRYLYDKSSNGEVLRPMNYGELVNSFSQDELIQILKNFFGVNVENDIGHGQLLLTLNHSFLMAQLREEA